MGYATSRNDCWQRLLLTCTTASGEPATITSDPKFIDQMVADLGFQPRRVIERVRYLASIPSEAPMQRRFSFCIEGYADRYATDVKLREKVASEVDQGTCARFQLCPREGLKRIDQSPVYAELLRVLAREMRGEQRADSNKTFMEHEAFVDFGRRLARLRGVEEAFSQASSVNGEISAPYILASFLFLEQLANLSDRFGRSRFVSGGSRPRLQTQIDPCANFILDVFQF